MIDQSLFKLDRIKLRLDLKLLMKPLQNQLIFTQKGKCSQFYSASDS
ncbi:unnamed protein product [Paramecium sonneborni]|uniref:Uncharacterized protein n=1 Tax=Paramecium sonneborni TaxID=65129 RepID=A0A8S1RS57_9CILI|nr:unnamed protein product [Paramecium sonneborni]